MFNDKYGLTQAVLKGRKTQTRRILNPAMLFERLGTYEGWAKESIADWKESCKARLYKAEGEELQKMLDYALEHSPYKVGETIAIAQKYEDLKDNDEFLCLSGKNEMFLWFIGLEKGFNNKMFVRADFMPHHICIRNIRVERMQDIRKKDCLAVGIRAAYGGNGMKDYVYQQDGSVFLSADCHGTAREAYKAYVDRVYGQDMWKLNPYVVVYDFELID